MLVFVRDFTVKIILLSAILVKDRCPIFGTFQSTILLGIFGLSSVSDNSLPTFKENVCDNIQK